jgi:hypothetical protein
MLMRTKKGCASSRAPALILVVCMALVATAASAHDPDAPPVTQDTSEHDYLADVGAKLANPVSDVWAHFTQFGLTFSDGDVNTGDPKIAGNLIYQPILPVPLFGEGDEQWKLIVRPAIPIVFGQPTPTGFNQFDRDSGIGDMALPLVASPPIEHLLVALGPTFLFPTSTKDVLGRRQFGIGPAGILGWKTKDWVAGVFPQYFFGIGSRGDQGSMPDASNMQLLYFFFYNLPDAWQIGFNPTITFDDKATSDNKWNVPIGLVVAKTTKIAGRPVKLQFGLEYSVVSQDDFGQRFQIKLNLIPVIQSLIKKPIFGGG